MKKFSRMPKSEGGSGGGGAAGGGAGGVGVGSGSSSVGVRVFAVGRYQLTLEESLAEGTGAGGAWGGQVREGLGCGGGFSGSSPSRLDFFPVLPPLLGRQRLSRGAPSGFAPRLAVSVQFFSL